MEQTEDSCLPDGSRYITCWLRLPQYEDPIRVIVNIGAEALLPDGMIMEEYTIRHSSCIMLWVPYTHRKVQRVCLLGVVPDPRPENAGMLQRMATSTFARDSENMLTPESANSPVGEIVICNLSGMQRRANLPDARTVFGA